MAKIKEVLGQQLKSMFEKPVSLISQILHQFRHVEALIEELTNKKLPLETLPQISLKQFKKTYLQIKQLRLRILLSGFPKQNKQLSQAFSSQSSSLTSIRSYSQIVGRESFQSPIQESNTLQVENSSGSLQYSASTKSLRKRGSYRSYTLQQKKLVLNMHKKGMNFAQISRRLTIPQKNIVRWCKNGVERKIGAGRKVGDLAMEKKMLEWMRCNLKLGSQVKGKQIREKAKIFSQNPGFKSSKGWLKNFIKRFELKNCYDII